jgi:hypothetical protein
MPLAAPTVMPKRTLSPPLEGFGIAARVVVVVISATAEALERETKSRVINDSSHRFTSNLFLRRAASRTPHPRRLLRVHREASGTVAVDS